MLHTQTKDTERGREAGGRRAPALLTRVIPTKLWAIAHGQFALRNKQYTAAPT